MQQASAADGRLPQDVAVSVDVTPDSAPTTRRPLSPAEAALVAEACTRSDLVWLRTVGESRGGESTGGESRGGESRHHAAWHVWHDDAVCIVYGAGEQALPLLSGEVEVVARSKDSGARCSGSWPRSTP